MNLGNTFLTGTKSAIGTSGVQLVNTTDKCIKGVQLYAPTTNSGVVYIGNNANMTKGTADATDGFPLYSGDSILLPLRDPSKIFVTSPVGGQKINWMLF